MSGLQGVLLGVMLFMVGVAVGRLALGFWWTRNRKPLVDPLPRLEDTAPEPEPRKFLPREEIEEVRLLPGAEPPCSIESHYTPVSQGFIPGSPMGEVALQAQGRCELEPWPKIGPIPLTVEPPLDDEWPKPPRTAWERITEDEEP